MEALLGMRNDRRTTLDDLIETTLCVVWRGGAHDDQSQNPTTGAEEKVSSNLPPVLTRCVVARAQVSRSQTLSLSLCMRRRK